ncbi:MAG: helix-turn-helix domain-containing protein [Cyclobacteriaceae bacterium]
MSNQNRLSDGKDIINSSEAAEYTGLAKSTIYKLIGRKEIPYYKPSGKLLYFKRSELDEYLTRRRFNPHDGSRTECSPSKTGKS